MKHVIIGTAGHIDHGKSALVLALTGTDPDRLQEEKARGITIDLGFAHTVQDGIALSFVDVPGHERFVRNMLAGVGGMDLVMLHVAADESVMPQTREHFEICRLLRVPAGLVVITKSDLADPATLDVVRLEVQELVGGSFLEHAPVVAMSARTGEGIFELRRILGALAAAAQTRACDGPPRLPVDRVFSMKGFGTVVTGTLIAGRLKTDDDLVLLPVGRTVKVRGLQVHGTSREVAIAGQRVALNLLGVDALPSIRGETLTRTDAVSVTRHVDVEVELLVSAKPLRHGMRVRFHQGTRELLGRVALPDATEVQPGAVACARLHLEAPAVLVRGDRFILRAYSPLATIAGGTVLDPLPPRRGVRAAGARTRFAALASSAPDRDAALTMIEEAGLAGLPESELVSRAGVPWSARGTVLEQLDSTALRVGGVLISRARVTAAEESMLAIVARHHDEHPLEEGSSREELRERVFEHAPPILFESIIRTLTDAGQIVGRDRIALARHRVALTDEESRVRDAIVHALSEAGLTPPDPAALATRLGAARELVDRLLALLIRQTVVVRAGDLMFHEAVLTQLKAHIREMKGAGVATLDVAAFKERYNVSRKYAIPLMEFLDRERITRRVGDTRRIL